jgi:hypothetical protein
MLMKPTRRSLGIAMVGVALLVGLAATGGTAGAGVAQTKMPLTDTGRNCTDNLTIAPTGVFGSATMNQSKAPGNGGAANLSAGLTIRGAARGATFNIRLIQVDNNGIALGSSCTTVVSTVTVDASGNGIANVAARALPGATGWWVDLNNQSSFIDFVDTGVAPISS